ncbi:MAG TPA: hypothetical protein VHR45_11295 [Thermoanaerobaculia bacterium]|nr:hypothetical protein [Thermoanaerobaculia bacterium]
MPTITIQSPPLPVPPSQKAIFTIMVDRSVMEDDGTGVFEGVGDVSDPTLAFDGWVEQEPRGVSQTLVRSSIGPAPLRHEVWHLTVQTTQETPVGNYFFRLVSRARAVARLPVNPDLIKNLEDDAEVTVHLSIGPRRQRSTITIIVNVAVA